MLPLLMMHYNTPYRDNPSGLHCKRIPRPTGLFNYRGTIPLDMFELVQVGPHCTVTLPPPSLESGRLASYWNALLF